MLTLTDCPVTCNALLNEEESMVLTLCNSCLVLEHHAAVSQALSILMKLIVYCYVENRPPPSAYLDPINLHLESFIYSSLVDTKLEQELKQYLICGVKLSAYNTEFGKNFTGIVGGLLTSNFGEFPKNENNFFFYNYMDVFNFSLSVKTFNFIGRNSGCTVCSIC